MKRVIKTKKVKAKTKPKPKPKAKVKAPIKKAPLKKPGDITGWL